MMKDLDDGFEFQGDQAAHFDTASEALTKIRQQALQRVLIGKITQHDL